MADILYLTLEQVLVLHDNQVELYGGSHGVRDLRLLESAVFRMQTTFGGDDLYPDIFSKGAALFHSILFNHAFIDANKRTAIVATIVFLELNNYRFSEVQNKIVSLILKIEKEKWDIEEIAIWLKKYSVKTN